jgi:hypothetical protein
MQDKDRHDVVYVVSCTATQQGEVKASSCSAQLGRNMLGGWLLAPVLQPLLLLLLQLL